MQVVLTKVIDCLQRYIKLVGILVMYYVICVNYLVVNQEGTVAVLKGGVSVEDSIVRLHNCR